MKYALLFLIILAFLSCDQNSPMVTGQNNITFNTDMAVADQYYGTFQSKSNNTEYVYFANVSTEKKIKVFDFKDSSPKYEIPLIEVLQEEKNGIENLSIISIDTILVLGIYSNNLYFLNKKGEIWKSIHLNDIVKHDQSYELSTSIHNDFIIENNSILLSPYWNYSNDTIEENFGDIEYVKLNRKNRWDSPYFMKFSNIFENIPNSETGYFQYQHLFPNNPFSDYIEFINYFVYSNYIYISSIFSNKIIKLNYKTLEVVDEIEINSEQTAIGIPLIPIGSEIRNYEQEYIDYFFSKGYIRKMFFNEKTQCFYFNVCIENNDNKTHNSEASRDWLIIIYDKDFNKITEHKIDNNKFYNNFLNTQNGVYIQAKRKINYKKQKIVFEKLDILSITKDAKPYDKIRNYFLKNNMELETVKSILVLTNQGTCMNCNKIFANAIETYTNTSNAKIIVTAEGNFIDISPFLDSKNVILDFEDEFSQLGLTNGTSAIFLGNEKIDTILNIKASTLEKQLEFIQHQVSSMTN